MGKNRDRIESQAGEELYYHCLKFLKNKDLDSCYDILPHISVIKDPRLLPIFREYLESGERECMELAACALAALGDKAAVPWLMKLFDNPAIFSGPGCQKFQAVILDAIGEIGHDSASDPLLDLFHRHIPGDRFRRKRRLIIVEVLGAIAQQGGERALHHLVDLMEHQDFMVRANAVTNISLAFWHRPNDLPREIFDRMLTLFKDSDLYVQYSLLSALENLDDVGCRLASDLFSD